MATGIYVNDDEETYTVTFPGHDIHTTVTSSGTTAAIWIATTRQINQDRLNDLIIGLGLQWPQIDGDAGFTSLILLCVNHRCLIFQIYHADIIPDELTEFLLDEHFRFVGVGIHTDVAKLEEDFDHELTVVNRVDLSALAAQKMDRPELSRAWLETLSEEVMGLRVSMPWHIKAGRWDRRILSMAQVKYACADAFASFEIGRRLFDL